MGSSDPATPQHVSRRGISLVKRVYFPRVLGLGLGSLCVGAGLYQLPGSVPMWCWVLLVFNGFVWPHIAYVTAIRSATPYQYEQRNLLIDAVSGGFWVPTMGFNLLPSVLILTMLSMDNIAVGGWRLFLKGVLGHLIGGAIAWLLFDVAFLPASNLTTLLVCIPFLVTYPLLVGIVTYRLSIQLSEQKRESRRISEQDVMSGVYSRNHWENRLADMFSEFQSRHVTATLMLIDVDRFKDINDRYGHLAGDEVIRSLGQVLRDCVRQDDVIGRYGGDEFGIILPYAGKDEACVVAERINSTLADVAVLNGKSIPSSLSIGIAELHPAMQSCDEWIACADKALYHVKSNGRGAAHVYDEQHA